ncbi:serine/threonine kinase family protein [Plesiocystis pacifica SIR-1]|uniref:Serine/threonine kinase family protein n=1 Tax=Plesiocystis pacifica SIR-1 TaxID=391625 RepID=A6G1T0_9BACT|nr:serine/threonine-protein kinase [Plesiocystis pacifica]EDM80120.1 serine/threonine kinase family protein [Plesiocystis pacifica SIR-1]
MAGADSDDEGEALPSLEDTLGGVDMVGETLDPRSLEAPSLLSGMGTPGRTAPPPVRVGALDAEHLRNSVAAKLFGAAADPVRIGRYTVLERLGAGGMGVVYSAYDTELDRKIAIKLLRGVDSGGADHSRLKREAQALAKLSHPNVVQVYDVGSFREQVFVAMEFIEGKTLRDWEPREGPSSEALVQILATFDEAGRGLAAAHAAGLVHRDFKPDNVLVGNDGRVRVLDFGLARGANDEPEPTSPSASDSTLVAGLVAGLESSDSLNQPLTQTGAILGTPAYMAPEQHMGRRADARSDQFAFCVALWEKLYGQRPFTARSVRQLAMVVIEGKVREPSSPKYTVPPYLRRALERGMSVDPDERWPSMEVLLAALSRDPRKRRRWIVSSVAAASMVLGAVAWLMLRPEGPGPCDGGERELVGVWDAQVRTKVESAFMATKTPYAGDAWTGTARLLDSYADDWVSMHREVCEASVVRKEEDSELFGRKMVCLGQRKTELEQLVGLLVDADEGVVSRAVVAAGSLNQVATCADADALVSEPADDERLEELERLIASASGSKALGKYDEGLEYAAKAVELAEAIGTPHGEGRALLVLGDLQSKRRMSAEAKKNLREALRRADIAGDDATRVSALTRLMHVAVVEHDVEAGELLADDARAALERLGDAPLLEADFYGHYGSLTLARDNPEGAIEYHRRALKISREQLGANHPEVAITHNNLANALTANGHHGEAEEHARKALAIFEAQLGADHPYAASSHNSIANSVLTQGRLLSWTDPEQAKRYFEQARDEYMKAVAIREANFGANSARLVNNLHNLGEAYRFLGDYERAIEVWERCLGLERANYKEKHRPVKLMTMTGLGRAYLASGKLERALELLEAATAIRLTRKDEGDAAGETFFAYAQALWERAGQDQDPALQAEQRRRAVEFARKAEAAYATAGTDYAGELRAVRRWLEKHAASVKPE